MRIWCALALVTMVCAAQENKRSISGMVATMGFPLPNVSVTLSGPVTLEVLSDNQGMFVFSGLKPGVYKLKFHKHGFIEKMFDVTMEQAPIFLEQVVLQYYEPYIIEVTYEDSLRGKVASECSGSICGAVFYGSTSVPNATVTLQVSGESHRVSSARTDTSGIFQLDKVKPGLYDLIIEAKGFKPAIVDSIAVQRGSQIKVPLVQLQRPTTLVR